MKKVICIVLTLLTVMLMVVPASALPYYTSVDIYTFEELKREIEKLPDEDAIVAFYIHNDITITETINIRCDNTELDFVNASDSDKVTLWVDNCLGFDINTYTDDVHMCFDGVKIVDLLETGYGGTARGIEVSAYSDGVEISGAIFYALGSNFINYGGAIYVNNDDCLIKDCTFIRCYAYREGGAIYINDDDVTIKDCTFSGCAVDNSESKGGGIAVSSGRKNILIDGCTFSNPAHDGIGQAVYGSGTEEKYTKVTNCNPKSDIEFWYANCYYADNAAGSLVSEGNLWIIIAVVIVAAGVAFFVIKKKKIN